jgi:hypothetical protein
VDDLKPLVDAAELHLRFTLAPRAREEDIQQLSQLLRATVTEAAAVLDEITAENPEANDDDVVELLTQRLHQVPGPYQDAVALAQSIGERKAAQGAS